MRYWHEGDYQGVITNAVLGESGNKKTPQVEITIDPTSFLDSDGEWRDPPNISRFPPVVYLYITEGTMGTASAPGWTAETLQFLGFKGDFDNIGDDLKQVSVNLRCEYEKGNDGKEICKWSIQRDRKPRQAAGKEVVRKVNTLYGNLFNGKSAGAAKQAPKATQTVPVDDAGEIPF